MASNSEEYSGDAHDLGELSEEFRPPANSPDSADDSSFDVLSNTIKRRKRTLSSNAIGDAERGPKRRGRPTRTFVFKEARVESIKSAFFKQLVDQNLSKGYPQARARAFENYAEDFCRRRYSTTDEMEKAANKAAAVKDLEYLWAESRKGKGSSGTLNQEELATVDEWFSKNESFSKQVAVVRTYLQPLLLQINAMRVERGVDTIDSAFLRRKRSKFRERELGRPSKLSVSFPELADVVLECLQTSGQLLNSLVEESRLAAMRAVFSAPAHLLRQYISGFWLVGKRTMEYSLGNLRVTLKEDRVLSHRRHVFFAIFTSLAVLRIPPCSNRALDEIVKELYSTFNGAAERSMMLAHSTLNDPAGRIDCHRIYAWHVHDAIASCAQRQFARAARQEVAQQAQALDNRFDLSSCTSSSRDDTFVAEQASLEKRMSEHNFGCLHDFEAARLWQVLHGDAFVRKRLSWFGVLTHVYCVGAAMKRVWPAKLDSTDGMTQHCSLAAAWGMFLHPRDKKCLPMHQKITDTEMYGGLILPSETVADSLLLIAGLYCTVFRETADAQQLARLAALHSWLSEQSNPMLARRFEEFYPRTRVGQRRRCAMVEINRNTLLTLWHSIAKAYSAQLFAAKSKATSDFVTAVFKQSDPTNNTSKHRTTRGHVAHKHDAAQARSKPKK